MNKTHVARLACRALLPALLTFSSATVTGQEFSAEGKYQLVQPPQATATPDKVEVLDVFWYGCPHCFDFLPVMDAYAAAKPDYVAVRRMPAIFRESWAIHARAYYTAKVLGVEERLHNAIFEEIHQRGRPLDTREAIAEFFVANGVSRSDFDNTFDSFAVESMLRQSLVMQGRYGIRGTPSVIINGKYRTSGRLAGGYENVVKVIQALTERESRQLTASQ